MAITQAICSTFKSELLGAEHNFKAVGGNIFKIALYTSAATLNATTTAYTATGEVSSSGTGYTTGGKVLTNLGIVLSGTTAYIDFGDVTWTTATFTAAGALIYDNSSSDKAVAVFNFGGNFTSTNGDFSVIFPAATTTTAVLILN
jgi:hypothetical protein